MATALAECGRDERGMGAEIVTGGVDPAESVHDEAVERLGSGTPMSVIERRGKSLPKIPRNAEYVVTMGRSVDQFRPDGWEGESIVWELNASDTDERRDELDRRVEQLSTGSTDMAAPCCGSKGGDVSRV
jgi:hypothetical protein